MANLIGTNGNDTLLGTTSADTINGKLGNDTITGNKGNDTLTGGGGKDRFIYNLGDGIDTITDFGGVGKGTNPTAGVIAEVDTIKFVGAGLTARNLLLTQNGTNLEITFEGVAGTKIVLNNFKLEDLENLKASGSTPAIGNIIFDGQSSIVDSFNVLDANSTETTIGIKNTVTFLNDLANNITALDNSNDAINGQGGNDKIDGLSGDDLLRGGAGNDTLIGGAGNDVLRGDAGNDSLTGGTGNNLLDGVDGNDTLSVSGYYEDEQYDYRLSGKNTLNGGAGNDNLSASGSTGDNLLSGGNGNDSLSISGYYTFLYLNDTYDSRSLGKNTLNGGAGDDNLSASASTGNNLLSGDDGNDTLSISGYYDGDNYEEYNSRSSGNNTLNGGAGNDILSASGSEGDNLLFGGDGNDSLSISGYYKYTPYDNPYEPRDLSNTYDSRSSGKNTLSGGTGNDTLNAGGSTGNNLLDGGDSNDILTASNATGNNILKGGNGNDTLTGGKGNDSLYGGSGIDTFVFNSFNEGVDKISDFNATNEVIQVSAAGFGGGLSAGVLKASQFTIGTSATTSSQRFIYNSTTGALFFDQDGSAGGFTKVQFALVTAGLPLTNNNFVVV
ncbi:MAG: beta strand repeat-containing protein [Nostoc sp. ChiSLP01]|nr:calcium-binding protein [Nostoc sp. CmiSLP01]MDZ8283001.1 calcium-binding protein [Nostoc sp. ChiSLP01]